MIPQNIGGKPALRDPIIPMSMLSVLSYHKDRSMLHTNLGSDKIQFDIQSRKRLHADFKKLHTKLIIPPVTAVGSKICVYIPYHTIGERNSISLHVHGCGS